ncbi:MAG: hypothetical protein PHX54_03795 [Lentimicrobiaceae bacterium]|nr:hypothetical protein [Lentimicrobiaceae bacterium]
MHNQLVAVLTGDIVHSSRMTAPDLKRLPGVLKSIFNSIDTICKPKTLPVKYSVFRGDSFQLVVEPALAVKTWLLIRAGLRAAFPAPLSRSVDATIAIAIGRVDYLAKNITESSGEVFNLSGRLLEKLKAPGLTGFVSANEQLNKEVNVQLLLADEIIRRWTTAQTLLLPMLMQSLNQSDIARETNTRQPTVAAKVNAMGWHAVEVWMEYFSDLVKNGLTYTTD